MPYGYGYGYYGGYSSEYVLYTVLMVVCFAFSLWAQASVKSAFGRYSQVRTRRGLTGQQAAECVLRANGVTGVRFARISGHLTDNFNPQTGIISLSDSVYASNSVAAVGVAAHEAGHAVQHAVGYGPIRLRMAIIPLCSFGSRASWPLLVIGLAIGSSPLVGLGVLAFSLATLFQLVTLPVELDASHRALVALRDGGLLEQDELPMARKTLRAAAMTYVAALATSIIQLLRLLAIFGNRNGGRRD